VATNRSSSCFGKEGYNKTASPSFSLDTEYVSSSSIVLSNGARTMMLTNTLFFHAAAFCYFVAMAASNESLRYVTYPTAVLAKSSKLIPTMVLGYLVERRHYNRHEWLAAACITSGVILFNLSRAPAEEQGENSTYGILLLCLSLVMDGLLGSCQGLLKKSTFPPTATETMLFVNLYAAAFFIPLSVYTNEWNQGWQLLRTNATIRHDILWLNAAAACGQIFIFLTITWYSSLMCTTITTTRKFFTILLSVLHFGHEFTRVQWTSVALVFAGLYTAIVSKARIQQEPTVMKKKTE
jgi:UDP-galactose transporter B1